MLGLYGGSGEGGSHIDLKSGVKGPGEPALSSIAASVRGGLAFEAHRLLSLNSRLESNTYEIDREKKSSIAACVEKSGLMGELYFY